MPGLFTCSRIYGCEKGSNNLFSGDLRIYSRADFSEHYNRFENNGEYEGLAGPLFTLGTAVIDGVFGLVIAVPLIMFVGNATGKARLIGLACVSGFIRAIISATMIYNRTTYGDRDFSGLPSWWYTNQLKVITLDLCAGFFIALIILAAMNFLLKKNPSVNNRTDIPI